MKKHNFTPEQSEAILNAVYELMHCNSIPSFSKLLTDIAIDEVQEQLTDEELGNHEIRCDKTFLSDRLCYIQNLNDFLCQVQDAIEFGLLQEWREMKAKERALQAVE